MKYYKLLFTAVAMGFFHACSDADLEFKVAQPADLALQDYLNQYGSLLSYVDFESNPDLRIGGGVGQNEYMNSVLTHRLITENFNEIAMGNEMKYASIVQNDGTLKFDNLDKFFVRLKSEGMPVFGHTLMWHAQQNKTWLNSILPATNDGNMWDVSGLSNGTFAGWSKRGGAANISVENGNLVLKASATSSAMWDLEIASPSVGVSVSHKYEVSFSIKSDKPGKLRNTFEGNVANAWMGVQYTPEDFEVLQTTTSWKNVSYTLNGDGQFLTGNNLNVNFLCGEVAGVTYYIKINSIKLVDKGTIDGTRSMPVSLLAEGEEEGEGEDAETILRREMDRWISGMVEHCAPYTCSWDVVNEAMLNQYEPGKVTLQTGKGRPENEVEHDFFWQDYFADPTDYAVEAFRLARKYVNMYGKPTDKLFINDYSLEVGKRVGWMGDDNNKCKNLIEYVKIIDERNKDNGGTVDGIGSQMHLGLSDVVPNEYATYEEAIANVEKICSDVIRMYQLLAATGKLIKLSELDIVVGQAHVPLTEAQLKFQSALYQCVIENFFKYIPKAQRYGIFFWGIADSGESVTGWLWGHEQSLWTTDYQRKYAYEGAVKGLINGMKWAKEHD